MASACPRSSASMPGYAPGCIDETEDRSIEFFRELHRAQSLSIPFGLWHPKISHLPLLRVAPFLMPNRRDRHSVKARKATDDRRVVGITTVAMNFDEVFEQPLDEIQRVRPIRMARKLHPLESCGWIFCCVSRSWFA